MGKVVTALPPSRLVGLHVREARKARGWTQGQLAQELRRVGIRTSQTEIARLEKLPGDKGQEPRRVTLEDWLALAFVLDIPPLALLLPADDERIAVGPEVDESHDQAQAWIVGAEPLDAQREPDRYRSYGRQDTSAGVGWYFRWLADLLDAESPEGQRAILRNAQELANAAREDRRPDT